MLRKSLPELEMFQVCTSRPQHLSINSTSTTYGRLSIRKSLVATRSNSLHPLRTLITPDIILYPCSQVVSEKADLLAGLPEYQKDIDLRSSLYNNKGLLDKSTLRINLRGL